MSSFEQSQASAMIAAHHAGNPDEAKRIARYIDAEGVSPFDGAMSMETLSDVMNAMMQGANGDNGQALEAVLVDLDPETRAQLFKAFAFVLNEQGAPLPGDKDAG
ncbi:hypothetical protein DMC64_41840 [Amycolatopsis sp. WAC 04197]|nr:hypothetical protein DMC64_41840 [Amycolatopsis sp. WAC 04197]